MGRSGGKLRVGKRQGTVIGVVKDFHYQSLRSAIPPLVMMNGTRIALAIRIRPGRVEETMAEVDRVWDRFFDQPNQLRFVDERWGWSYHRERHLGWGYSLLSWTALSLRVWGSSAWRLRD